jgi:Uma2 family endonuclease
MNVATTPTLISVEEYLRTSYKPACDYIDGVLRQKPMPTYNHSKMQKRLMVLIDGLRSSFDAVPELTVKLTETRYLVPDVAVQRVSELQQPYPTKPVYLCIEVLSPEDRFSEMVAKCEDYHAWGVKFCWIIDPDKKQCWEYESGGRPHDIQASGQITAGEIRLNFDDVFDGF